MDTLAVEAPETWNRRSPQELKKAFEEHGITAATTVVLYGKFVYPDNNDPFPGSAAGDIAAIRCAFIMMYAGVKDVRILNGGFQSWEDAGYNISFTDEHKKSVDNFGVYIPARPELAAGFDVDQFEQHTEYNPLTGEVKSFLVSKTEQSIYIGALEQSFHFKQWEPVFMELSRKFDFITIQELAESHGFSIVKKFTDSRVFFVDSLWERN